MKHIFAALVGLALSIFSNPIFAQKPAGKTLYGIVTNDKEELLIGATVFWKGTTTGVVTDTTAHFRIPRPDGPATLVVRYVGHTPAEVEVLPTEDSLWIEIAGVTEIQQVTITGHGFGNSVSMLDPRNVESINRRELRKAPCCNLSESFETTGAVDVTYPNAVTGVKEIQMLGLRGIYSQFLLENRPTLGGIATPFAFEMIPGTWLDGLVLAKGASTVKNGFAGITGQINADLVKPHLDKPLFVNAFTSTEGRGELNVHLNKKGKRHVSNGLLLHGNFVENRWDMNRDNFYDSPNRRQLNGLYRMMYESPVGCAQFNVQAVTDRRFGGQISPLADGSLFQVDQQNERVEAWGKYGREGLFGKPYNEVGNMVGVSWHRANSVFGRNSYRAEQKSVYWQTLYQTILGTTDHKIVVAPNVQYDDYQEFVNEGDLSRRDFMPGFMAEYTYLHLNPKLDMADLTLVIGGRVDWHSRFGWFATPRMSAKYNFTKNTVVRASAGRGYRSPNVMAENISSLASNRTFHFASDLGAEEAWNYGLSLAQEFKIADRPASFSVDAFRTDFVRQIVVDVEADPTAVYFFNLQGKSYSNSLLAVWQWNAWKGLDVKIAWKMNDVQTTYMDGELRSVPLVARHRGLVTADYNTPNKKWMFNAKLNIVGPQRIPDNSQVPHDFLHGFAEGESPTYALASLQITRRWHKTELYLGSENLTNYQQHHAIIAANEPQSAYFNASQQWAPMMGAIVYAGVRFSPSGAEAR